MTIHLRTTHVAAIALFAAALFAFATPKAKALTVTTPDVTNATDTSMTVTWQTDIATEFNSVLWATSLTGPIVNQRSVAPTVVTKDHSITFDHGLGRNYGTLYVWVQSEIYVPSYVSAISSRVEAKLIWGALNITSGPTASNVGTFSATVSWGVDLSADNNIVSYQTVGPVPAECSGVKTVSGQSGASPSYSLSGLCSSTLYEARVTSQKAGYSDATDVVAFKTIAPYTLSAAPTPINVPKGSNATFTLTITRAPDFPPTTLYVGSFASPSFSTFAPQSYSPSDSIQPTVTTVTAMIGTGNFSIGESYAMTFTLAQSFATGMVYSSPVTFTVTPPAPACTLSLTPSSLTVAQGQPASYTLTTTALNGLVQPLDVTLVTPPSTFPSANVRVNGVALPSSIGANGTWPLTADTTGVTPSATPYVLHAKASTVQDGIPVTCESANVQLTVSSASYQIAVEPMAQTVAKNTNADFTVAVTPIGTYIIDVTLDAAAGDSRFGRPLPTTATKSFIPDKIASRANETQTLRINTSTLDVGMTYSIKVTGSPLTKVVDGILLTITGAETCSDGTAVSTCASSGNWCDGGGVLRTDCGSRIDNSCSTCPTSAPYCNRTSGICENKCNDGTQDQRCSSTGQWCDTSVSRDTSTICSVNKENSCSCVTGVCQADNTCSTTCSGGVSPGVCNTDGQLCKPDLTYETRCDVNQTACHRAVCPTSTPYCNLSTGICEGRCTGGEYPDECNRLGTNQVCRTDFTYETDCGINADRCGYTCPAPGVCDRTTGLCSSTCEDGTAIGVCNATGQLCQGDGTLSTSCVVNDACPSFSCPAATTCNPSNGLCEADSTPPTITAIRCVPSVTSATVMWTTNEAANSEILWRPASSPSYTGGKVSDPMPPGTTSHVVPFSPLIANTLYYVKVKSTDGNSNTAEAAEIPCTTLAAPDTEAPVVRIDFPASSAIITSSTAINATATDNVGITKVEFYHSGTTLIGSSPATPYTTTWNVSSLPSGTYGLTARAYDAAGNVGISPQVNVIVNNDTTPPVISGFSFVKTSPTEIKVTWTTNELATRWVYYCYETSAGGPCTYDQKKGESTPLMTSHTVTLTNLQLNRNVRLTPVSCNATNNCNQTPPF